MALHQCIIYNMQGVSSLLFIPKMASFRLVSLYLTALSFSLSYLSHSSASLSNTVQSSFSTYSISNVIPSQEKVTLSLYYESLCPYCSDFIVNGLAKAVTTDLINIVDLKLIPWGNAVLKQPFDTIVCQITHFNFIRCLEGHQESIKDTPKRTITNGHSKIAEDAWKNCTFQLKLDADRIASCITNGTGRKLALQYGEETNKLNPPHEFVPWVVVGRRPLMAVSNSTIDSWKFVEGYTWETLRVIPHLLQMLLFLTPVWLMQAYNSFAEVVCRTYRGDQIPSACKSAFTVKG